MNSPDRFAGTQSLHEYLIALTSAAEVSVLPDEEEWTEVVNRLSVAGRIAEISADVWEYFLEVLPPKLMGRGYFCFAEGQEPLRIFWRQQGKYFGRQLSQQETDRLCDLAGLPRDYGAY